MLKLVYANLSLSLSVVADCFVMTNQLGHAAGSFAAHVHTFTYIQTYAGFVKDSLINLN